MSIKIDILVEPQQLLVQAFNKKNQTKKFENVTRHFNVSHIIIKNEKC